MAFASPVCGWFTTGAEFLLSISFTLLITFFIFLQKRTLPNYCNSVQLFNWMQIIFTFSQTISVSRNTQELSISSPKRRVIKKRIKKISSNRHTEATLLEIYFSIESDRRRENKHSKFGVLGGEWRKLQNERIKNKTREAIPHNSMVQIYNIVRRYI